MHSSFRSFTAPAVAAIPSTTAPSFPEGQDTHDADRPRAVGKYIVSPLVRALDNGWFATSVSIRSGRGAATTDRVLRLTRLFQCAQQAASYARAEALQWISAPPRLALA